MAGEVIREQKRGERGKVTTTADDIVMVVSPRTVEAEDLPIAKLGRHIPALDDAIFKDIARQPLAK